MLYPLPVVQPLLPVTNGCDLGREPVNLLDSSSELNDALFPGPVNGGHLQRRWAIIRDIKTITEVDDPRVQLITEALRSDESRQSLLEAVTHAPGIVSTPQLRALMLDTVVDCSPDSLVLKFAAQSLCANDCRSSIGVVDPSTRILGQLTHPYARLREMLFETALPFKPDSEDHAGPAALALLKGWGIPEHHVHQVSGLTLDWYRRYPGRMNPWLEYLTKTPTDNAAVTAAMILMGSVPFEEFATFYKKVAYDSIISGTAGKIIAVSLQVAAQPPLWVAMNIFGVVTLLTSGFSWIQNRSEFYDKTEALNRSRLVERMQAVLCLDDMATVCEQRGEAGDRRLRRLITKIIVTARDCVQPPELYPLLDRVIERGNPPGLVQDLWSFDEHTSKTRSLELPHWT